MSNTMTTATMTTPMTMTPTMPGAFFPNHGDETNFIRPIAVPSFYIPPSPSAISTLSSSFQSISRASSTSTLSSRKRGRLDVAGDDVAMPRRRTKVSSEQEVFSPPPLVNSDYRIAGGLDIPPTTQMLGETHDDYDYELDHRPNRYNRQQLATCDGYFPQTPRQAVSTSRKRRHSASPRAGWGRTVWDLTGGVAGKVINFCINTAFNGFHAGGGRGYNIQVDTPTVTAADLGYQDTTQDVFGDQYRARGMTPVPGTFPQEDLIEDYMSQPGSHQYQETPTQTASQGASSLRSSWVMVNEPYSDSDRSPVRKRARPSTAQMYARSTSRQSMPARPRLQGRGSAGGASFASPRASGASLATSFRPASSDGPEKRHKLSRSSFASSRRSELVTSDNTPKSPEVIKFEKKIKRQDQRQDESLHRMSQQMQDMMREAQQALAAKIEVSEEVDDEGYGDEIDEPVRRIWR